MSNRKWIKWVLMLALMLSLVLVACGGDDDTTDVDEPAADVDVIEVEEPVVEEPVVEEPVVEEPVVEEPVEEEVVEEPVEEEVVEEPVEEEVVEEEATADLADPTLNGITECIVATDGPLAGIDPTGQNIVWWHQHSGSREELLLPLVAEFNETNACGITVEALNQGGYDDIRDQVNASIAAGEQPAALIVGYQNDQAFYELNDALVDLEPFMTSDVWGFNPDDLADFYAAFLEQGVHPSFDNQQLGFPPNRSMEVLFYNQTWLEELGFDGPPQTPAEFEEMACAAADAAGDGTGGYILRDDASAVAAWSFAFGGDVLNEDGSGYVYNNEATAQALAFLKDLYDQGCAYFFTEGFPNPEFAARRALFTQGSSSGIPFYEGDVATVAEEQGREADQWGVTAIPYTGAEPVQNIYGADVMITETTPEQELAAWIFTKWFTTPEVQARWAEISGYFPTRQATDEFLEGYSEENPQWGSALELLQFGYYEPQLISYQGVRDRISEAFNVIMQLPEDVGVDNTEPIEEILAEVDEFANEQQAELMSEIEE